MQKLIHMQTCWILVLRACRCMGLQNGRLGECVCSNLLQLSEAADSISKRVFLLFPSHHYYLSGAATTGCDKYATPIGDLTIDTALVRQIQEEWGLEVMKRDVDEDEHSSEMHLPYIFKMLSLYSTPCLSSRCTLIHDEARTQAFKQIQLPYHSSQSWSATQTPAPKHNTAHSLHRTSPTRATSSSYPPTSATGAPASDTHTTSRLAAPPARA